MAKSQSTANGVISSLRFAKAEDARRVARGDDNYAANPCDDQDESQRQDGMTPKRSNVMSDIARKNASEWLHHLIHANRILGQGSIRRNVVETPYHDPKKDLQEWSGHDCARAVQHAYTANHH